ncbi:uncharacterized protein LOC131652438 [Vicia villosa]|uniref:uncharacterized protein LOC131652438 n=1 Tax=Vicia villosa TaxID=3911 RepID=UPI00273C9481|nr:uncharacterized protein LOC131652438 [Vicia villosa]
MQNVNFHRRGHFARDCNAKLMEYQSDEAKIARHEVDEDNTFLVMITEENYGSNQLLDSSCSSSKNAAKTRSEQNVMVTVRDGVQDSDEWYLDSGCSTHMTGRKDLFVKINQATKNKVKFTDDTTLAADGVSDVFIMKRDSGPSLITYVLYIPELNVIS